jgi:hypothetical protein
MLLNGEPDGSPTNATGENLYKECIGKSGESRAKTEMSIAFADKAALIGD